MAPFPEVRDEEDDDEDSDVVAARDEAAAGAGEVETLLQRRRDHVDETVDGHALGDDKEASE